MKKAAFQHRKWLILACVFLVVLIFSSPLTIPYFAEWIFINERFEVEIPQDIGGKLVCQGSYGCDQHDCESEVDYSYVNSKGETSKIGFGFYDGQNWDRNVQIQRIQNHLLLKAELFPYAVIFIGELNGAKWIKYDFSLDKINSNPVWKATGIESLPQYSLYSATEITEIMGDGEIDVIYKFVINNNRDTDKRLLVYKLNSGGVPQLTEIKDI